MVCVNAAVLTVLVVFMHIKAKATYGFCTTGTYTAGQTPSASAYASTSTSPPSSGCSSSAALSPALRSQSALNGDRRWRLLCLLQPSATNTRLTAPHKEAIPLALAPLTRRCGGLPLRLSCLVLFQLVRHGIREGTRAAPTPQAVTDETYRRSRSCCWCSEQAGVRGGHDGRRVALQKCTSKGLQLPSKT